MKQFSLFWTVVFKSDWQNWDQVVHAFDGVEVVSDVKVLQVLAPHDGDGLRFEKTRSALTPVLEKGQVSVNFFS